ncbi:MAG: ExbD/TolR family protein [Gammaproteobacteria bacterium]
MQFRRRSARTGLGIDITPLIDVVFLLLIFFMVTTTFSWQTELMINLPEAEGEQVEVEPKAVQVSVDKDGNYFINSKPLVNNHRITLMQALKELSSDPQVPLVITGDAMAPHQAIVTVLDVAGQVGFSKIEITAKKPEEK